MPDAEKVGRCTQVRDLFESDNRYWDSKLDAFDELERFVAGDRYENDNGSFQKDRRLQQMKGAEIQDTIRHIVAKATEKARSVDPAPTDREDDPLSAEAIAALVEKRLARTDLGFEDEYEDAIIDARTIRLGVLWMTWHEDAEWVDAISYACENPRNFRWDTCYKNPHHPRCGWLIRKCRVDVKRARKKYKAPWLEPDPESTMTRSQTGQPVMQAQGSEELPTGGDQKVTIWECWYKNADYQYDYQPEPLPEGERYMACLGGTGEGCGDRSETQDQLGFELPEEMPSSCPTCGGDMERVDVPTEEEQKRDSGAGKTLVIMAPFCPNPKDAEKPLYDGPWPIKRARSFPGMFITAYSKPRDPIGPCDTDYLWQAQVALDNLDTIALQRVYEHAALWIFPGDGLMDFAGNRFEKRDDQYNIAFWDYTAMGKPDIQMHNATGVDPAYALVRNNFHQRLIQNRGIHDQGPIEERSNAKSGVALQTENAIGEVPGEHFKRRLYRFLSCFYGVAADYELAILTEEIATRLNIEGVGILTQLAGSDFGRFDFQIEDHKDFTGLDEAKAKAIPELFNVAGQAVQLAMQLGTDPREAARLAVEMFAEANNMPKSITSDFQKMLAAPPPMMPGMMDPGAGGGLPGEGAGEAPALDGLPAPNLAMLAGLQQAA